MEMCPYCGEEVPQDSTKCWKCGTELSEGGAAKAEGEDLEVPDDDDDEGEDGKPIAVIECPFCGETVSKKSLRCKECGRVIQKVQTNATAVALWKWGVWAVVLVVAVSTTTAVIIYSQKRALQTERAAKGIGASFDQISGKIQPHNKGFKEERRREVWEKDFERRFVHWIDGVVQEKDGQTLKISHTKGQSKPDCAVTFLREEDLASLNVGDKIEYSARLIGYGQDGFAFTLADGMLDKKEPKDAK